MKKNKKIKIFFCPGSDYLNQQNETGSHGQLSYNFIKHLAEKPIVQNIDAVVMMSTKVEKIQKTNFHVHSIKKDPLYSLNDFDSLFFYLRSFFNFRNRSEYKEANIVHHLIPFKFGRSFNLFFIFKNKTKKHVIGPIVSPHLDEKITDDEEYVFQTNKTVLKRIKKSLFDITKKILLFFFGKILFLMSIKTFQSADILFFSDNFSLSHHKKYIKSSQQVHLLDTGVDVNVFMPKRVTKKKKINTIKVLFVGRLTKRKGSEYLIHAIRKIKQKNPEVNVVCSILGYGPLEEKLRKKVKTLGLSKNIQFLKGVKSEQLVHYYYDCDVVCIPALSDTFTVIKESLLSGKPVIVTDVSSHAERVEHMVNGIVVPVRDASAIAKALVLLAVDNKLYELLVRNAPKSANRYNWSNIAEKYLVCIG